MQASMVLVLVLVLALEVEVQAIVCTPGVCDGVRCARVVATNCAGVVRQNATFCGCCARCVTLIQAGGTCISDILGLPPASECVSGTACVNNVCTSIADLAQQ